MQLHILLALIGAAGGLIAGTVGLAGGIFLVPAVVLLLGPDAMGEAIAISFFAVFLNSLAATLESRKARGQSQYWALVRGAGWYTAGAALTALLVAVVVGRHPGIISRKGLAALQLLLAVCMLVPRPWYERLQSTRLPVKDAAVGSLVGGLSTLIGVGGGTYTIFYFLVHGREIKDCTLTANFVGIFVGLMGVVGYYGSLAATKGALSGHVIDVTGQWLLIGCGALASPVGVRLQARVPASGIKKLVVLFLALSSGYALLGA
jgi:uncharacterized membrane protein YfcA